MPQPDTSTDNNALDRRTFVRRATLATAGAISIPSAMKVSTFAGQATNPTETRKMGSNSGVIFKALKFGDIKIAGGYEEKFKAIKDLGFDGVEFPSPSKENIAAAREASEKVGLPIHGVVDSTHWNIRLSDKDAKVRERGLSDLLTAIRDSHTLGGNAVLLVPGHGNDGTKEQVEQRSIEQIRKALPLAARLGQRILIENVWNHFLYKHDGPADQSADALADYLDKIDSPWVGSYFDIGNHRKYGVPSQWAKTLGKRIVKLDVKGYDHHTQKWTGIGEGSVDWAELRTVLKEIGFTGWATAEVGGGDAKRLKQIADRMDKVLDL